MSDSLYLGASGGWMMWMGCRGSVGVAGEWGGGSNGDLDSLQTSDGHLLPPTERTNSLGPGCLRSLRTHKLLKCRIVSPAPLTSARLAVTRGSSARG